MAKYAIFIFSQKIRIFPKNAKNPIFQAYLSLIYFTRPRYDSESWRRVRICRRQREALSNLNRIGVHLVTFDRFKQFTRLSCQLLTSLSPLKPCYTCENVLNIICFKQEITLSFKAVLHVIFLNDFLNMHLHIIGSVTGV